LVIFAGSIAGDQPGVGRMETYVLIPPEPITTYYYRCEHRFVLEPLWELLRAEDAYGIVVIDAKEATLALAKGRRIDILKEVTSGVPGKHRAGGQSARRFERLREMALNEYYRRVGEYINELLLKIPDLKGIIFGGPGPTKSEFLERDLLHYELKDKVLTVVDTAYTGIEGVKEVVDRAKDFLEGLRYSEERRIVQEFLRHVGRDTGLATYGDREVMRELRSANVKVLLLSEGVGREVVRLRCKECGYMEERIIERADNFMEELLNVICPRCGKAAYEVGDRKELLERLIEMAEEVDAKVEVISTETEEGEMLLKSFGGVAAILRHRTY
jgi:peptide chain release factor subunit 1